VLFLSICNYFDLFQAVLSPQTAPSLLLLVMTFKINGLQHGKQSQYFYPAITLLLPCNLINFSPQKQCYCKARKM